MNSFVPFDSFADSARYLDNLRLTKQVSECGQMLRVIENWTPRRAWAKHPAVLMWVQWPDAFAHYMWVCEQERLRRNMNPHKEWHDRHVAWHAMIGEPFEMPDWWGGAIHGSHLMILNAKWSRIPHDDYRHLYYWPSDHDMQPWPDFSSKSCPIWQKV